MKNVIICDLDGTLANCEHRVHHVQKVDGNGLKKRPNWEAFYAGVKDDTVNPAVGITIRSLLDGDYPIIFCSGRPERCRADTEAWLAKHYIYDYTLLMRPDGDFRADYIVKQEILDNHIDKDRVLFVMDDRQQVVDMWRRNGLTCFQVAKGDF
jgi:hydroxymethylpyrimidine pyrophosphatase-like HAD family hydrolase